MKYIFQVMFLCVVFTAAAASQSTDKKSSTTKPKIMFVELGSANCIPCKKMVPVMKAIEEKYGSQVKVIFYDVRTEEQQSYGEQYNIRLIPTQVFLDENSKEFFRHEGFFPEDEIHKIFKQRGLTPSKIGG